MIIYNQGGQNRTKTALESRAGSLLLDSIRSIGEGVHKHLYPTEFDTIDGVVDTTTTLISARTFSKLGRSDLAWEFLRTLFSGQGNNGFLPRYVYLNHTDVFGNLVSGCEWNEFIGPYPGPKLFPNAKGNTPPSSSNELHSNVKIWTSNTLMSPPYHSTTILEIFYLSNQTDVDVDSLEFFYVKLQKWHDYLHKQITSNCVGELSSSTASTTHHAPCLTIHHPWETDIEMKSILWNYALENVTKIVTDTGWTPNFDIPLAVQNTFDYPGDETYKTLLYLLQCLSDNAESDDNNGHKSKGKQSIHDLFHSSCPFQMVDGGIASALAKADEDLLKIGEILTDKNRIAKPSWSAVEMASERVHNNKRMIDHLWHDDQGFFFNNIVNLTMNANGTYTSNVTTPLMLPVGSNFDSLWYPISNATMLASISSHLLQRTGHYSFSCGDVPLWSIGGCDDSDPPLIHVLRNYRVARGLRYNKEVGIGHFIESSTLNLICGIPNSDESNLTNCIEGERFTRAYNATSHLPMGTETTLTAAIVVDLLNPDKPFKYASEPPISSSSIIILIAVELVLAFGVGVICLVLSLNLMRRATADEEGDEFVQIALEEQPEEELLVQSLDDEADNAVNESFGQSIVELISRFNPMYWVQ